jgi:hypothetical protein
MKSFAGGDENRVKDKVPLFRAVNAQAAAVLIYLQREGPKMLGAWGLGQGSGNGSRSY